MLISDFPGSDPFTSPITVTVGGGDVTLEDPVDLADLPTLQTEFGDPTQSISSEMTLDAAAVSELVAVPGFGGDADVLTAGPFPLEFELRRFHSDGAYTYQLWNAEGTALLLSDFPGSFIAASAESTV